MTLLKTLRAHTGGLLRIKSQLYWYGGRGWDAARGRVCLLLDAVPTAAAPAPAAFDAGCAASAPGIAALLLIDGCPHWVWVSQQDVEIL